MEESSFSNVYDQQEVDKMIASALQLKQQEIASIRSHTKTIVYENEQLKQQLTQLQDQHEKLQDQHEKLNKNYCDLCSENIQTEVKLGIYETEFVQLKEQISSKNKNQIKQDGNSWDTPTGYEGVKYENQNEQKLKLKNDQISAQLDQNTKKYEEQLIIIQQNYKDDLQTFQEKIKFMEQNQNQQLQDQLENQQYQYKQLQNQLEDNEQQQKIKIQLEQNQNQQLQDQLQQQLQEYKQLQNKLDENKQQQQQYQIKMQQLVNNNQQLSSENTKYLEQLKKIQHSNIDENIKILQKEILSLQLQMQKLDMGDLFYKSMKQVNEQDKVQLKNCSQIEDILIRFEIQ